MSVAVWGAVARELGLTVSLEHSGFSDPAVCLTGPWGGGYLTLIFGRGGAVGLVLATNESQALMGDHEFRLAPQGQVPGVPGVLTGDPAFDAAVAVYADDPREVLPRLGAAARRRLAALFALGGWCTSDTVHLEPEALATAGDPEAARRLLGVALDALAALAEPTRVQLMAQAFGDEPAPVSGASRAVLEGELTPDELLDRLPAQLSRADRAQVLALRPETPETWARWLARLSALEGPEVLLALLDAVPPAPAKTAVATRFAATLWAKAPVSDEVLDAATWLAIEDGACLEAFCAALVGATQRVHEGRGAAVAWLETLPFGDGAVEGTDRQLAVVDALLALHRPTGLTRLLEVEARHPGPAAILARRLAKVGAPGLERLVEVVLRWPEAPVCDAARAALVEALPAALATRPVAEWAARLGAKLPARLLTPLASAALARPQPGTLDWLLSLPVPDPLTAQALAGWLGQLGDPRAEGRLLAWLGHNVTAVRLAAVEALGGCGTLGAIGRLEDLTGFFASGTLKGPAQAAIAAIRARGVISPAGGLTPTEGEGGGLSSV